MIFNSDPRVSELPTTTFLSCKKTLFTHMSSNTYKHILLFGNVFDSVHSVYM